MCPIDPTPHGGEILHEIPEQPFPKPPVASTDDEPEALSSAPLDAEEISHRPSLPTGVLIMAADLEDEDDDPVVDTGPGIDR